MWKKIEVEDGLGGFPNKRECLEKLGYVLNGGRALKLREVGFLSEGGKFCVGAPLP